jgi:LacI family transcriptional regulator
VHFGFVDRPPINFEADTVLSINNQGAYEAVQHLISFGHKKIAFLGDDPNIYTARERYEGYAKALKAAKIPLEKQYIFRGFDSESEAISKIRALLQSSDAPTAFFTSQNLLTMVVLKALRSEGVEHQIALVGFDDLPAAELLSPGVTLVKQDIAEIGLRSIQMLFDRINGSTSKYSTVSVPTILVPMGSGEIKPR